MSKSNKKIITIDAKKWLSQVTMPVTQVDRENYYLLTLPALNKVARSPFVKAYERRDENAVFDQMELMLDEYYKYIDRHPCDPDQPIVFMDFGHCFDEVPRVSTATYKGKTVLDLGQPDESIKEEIEKLLEEERKEKIEAEKKLAKANQDTLFLMYYELVLSGHVPVISEINPWIRDIEGWKYSDENEDPIPVYGEEHLNIVNYRSLSDEERANIEYYKVQIYEDFLKLEDKSEENLNKSAQNTVLLYFDKHADAEKVEVCEKKKNSSILLRRLKELFGHGFVLRFEAEEDYWGNYETIYVPFEKSASMARRNKMSFIEKTYAEILNERLLLGIDFSKISVPLSKFYAYKGLYFSTAKRIDPNALNLNQDTVIILDDKLFDFREEEKKAYTAYIAEPRNAYEKEKITRTNEKFDFKKIDKDDPEHQLDTNARFDGEGIMSEKMQRRIVKELGIDPKAASFQIRLPFAKGMLHTVQFHEFIQEYGILDKDGSYWVEDAFEIPRDIMKAEIILTKSMFKMYSWLKGWIDQYGRLLGTDPMKYYFKMVAQYKHSLYICRDDLSFQNGSLTSCNYQFLNTLHLNWEEYESLFSLHKEYICKPEDYISKVRDTAQDDEDNADPNEVINLDDAKEQARDEELEMEEEDSFENADMDETIEDGQDIVELPDQEEEEQEISMNGWIRLLKKNSDIQVRKRLLSDPYVQKQLINMGHGRMKDLGYGRLLLPGEVRFLSRDLLCFLYTLLLFGETRQMDFSKKEEKNYIENKNRIKKELLQEDYFDMPGNNIELEQDNYYPVFRNPHLSRCEQSCLKYLEADKNSIRSRYLGQLKGTIMVSLESFVPIILGGADFDGDIIKIFNQNILRDSVLHNVYGMKGLYKKGRTYKRCLPIVTNYAADKSTVKNAKVQLFPDFEVLHNTFSNNIGALSNLAALIGAYEYSGEIESEALDMVCEKLNILVGIDIDAAKSGQRADLTEVQKTIKTVLNVQYDTSLSKARKDSFVGGFMKGLNKTLNKRNYFNPTQLCKDSLVAQYTQEDPLCVVSLEHLPYLFKQSLVQKVECEQSTELPFPFLKQWDAYKEELKEYEALKDRLAEIVKAYKDVFLWISKANRKYVYEMRTSYISQAAGIISRHGMPYMEAIMAADSFALNLYEVIGENLNSNVLSQKEVKQIYEEMIARLKQSDWPYLYSDEDKLAVMQEVVSLNADVNDFDSQTLANLMDFSDKGFLLFYILLKMSGYLYKKHHKGEFLSDYLHHECEIDQFIGKDAEDTLYNAYVKELTDGFIEAVDTCVYEKKLYTSQIINAFMERMRIQINAIFEEDAKTRQDGKQMTGHQQFMLVYQMLEENKLLQKGYLWNLFSVDRIQEEIEGLAF